MNSPRRRPLPPEATNVLEAFRESCFKYPDGVPELAALLGMSPAMLYNKANANDASHPPTLADAVQVIRETGNPLIAQAMAHVANGAFLPLDRSGGTSNDEMLLMVARWMREQGRFFEHFDSALLDGEITAKERHELTLQAHRVVTACLDLVARIESSERGRP